MIIKNALLCENIENGILKNIIIKDGVIEKILDSTQGVESLGESSDEIIDLGGKILLPQFIDLNVYPKNKTLSRSSLLTLSKKATSGGVGVVLLHSDTNPRIDSEIALEFINSINRDLDIEILPMIASTSNLADLGQEVVQESSHGSTKERICDIAILNTLGGKGIFLQSNAMPNTIDKVAKYAKMLDIPLFVNAYDGLGGVINYGNMSAKLGLIARNPLSEIKEVAKILEVAIFYDIKVVFSAISEPRSIELIESARKINPKIFCETSLHHLILDDSACERYNTSAKINPPLKDKKTKKKLLQALCDGNIHALTSLQSACYNSKKEVVFDDASFGIDAIPYYFSIAYTSLVREKVITLPHLITLCAENPAKILGLNYGISQNKQAKLMEIDLEAKININDSFLPYCGEYYGVVNRFI